MEGIESSPKKPKPENGALVFQPILLMQNQGIPPVEPPHFKIWSLYVGQGDCFIIRCPDLQFIMIDCGSVKTEPLTDDQKTKILNKFNEIFTKSPKVIKALIITHSDEDHHNKVGLLENANFLVEQVIIGNYEWTDLYFKDKGSKATMKASTKEKAELTKKVEDILKSPEETWKYWCEKFKRTKPDTLTILKNRGCKDFIGLTFNSILAPRDSTQLNSRIVHLQFDDSAPDKPALISRTFLSTDAFYQGFYTVHGKDDNLNSNDNWSVKIIAAQVESDDNEKSAFMNAASLVTVFQIGNRKALFTGDSTGATFKYLLRQDLPDYVKNLFGDMSPILPPIPGTKIPNRFELLQVPHHGSNTHESHLINFINKAKSMCVLTSVRFNELKYRLPKWEALTRWKNNDRIYKGKTKDHYIGYWINAAELKGKRIMDAVNPFLDDQSAQPTDKELETLFPSPLNKANRPKIREKVKFRNLKYNAKPEKAGDPPRDQNLYLIGGNSYKYVFVVQHTSKAVACNGADAIRQFLDQKIKANEGEKEFEINTNELVNFAFDNISHSMYQLDANQLRGTY